uniref:Uncharacterized protein n=1 Tax=Solanum tuberosum TaxID=4113 RepID=M1B272_SOLTU
MEVEFATAVAQAANAALDADLAAKMTKCDVIGVLASIRNDDEAIDPVGIEIWKPCPYHDAIDHNIGRFLRFRYDVESLVNMGKIQVEFVPRG